jgi:hypothetical protein
MVDEFEEKTQGMRKSFRFCMEEPRLVRRVVKREDVPGICFEVKDE